MIQFAIYTAPGGSLIADYSDRIQGATIASNNRGFAECKGFIPLSLADSFRLYDRPGLPHVAFSDSSSGAFYEGRLEDVNLAPGGVNFTAYGYSRSLSDAPYTALWSLADVTQFRPFTADDVSTATPDRYAFDTTNRIYITPQKGATLGNTGAGKQAMIGLQLPDQGSRDVIGASFDFTFNTPSASWRVAFQTRNVSFGGIANPWLITGGVGITPGNVLVTFAAAKIVNFFMDLNAADAVFAGETGSSYLIITNLRLVTTTANMISTTCTANTACAVGMTIPVGSTARMYAGQRLHIGHGTYGVGCTVTSVTDTTHFVTDIDPAFGLIASGDVIQAFIVYADDIVKDLVTTADTLNPTQINSSTALIQSPGLDLLNESYEDKYPADILDYLVKLGDNQARQWEWGVYGDQRLYFRPQGSAARVWYVDASELNVQRTIDSLYNAIYATYQSASGRTLRTATNTDAASVARYGVTRRRVQAVTSTSGAQAIAQRDAALADSKNPPPRSGLTIDKIYDGSGSWWPLWILRAGDTIVIRNLPPTLSTAIDKIRIFRVTRAEFDIESNTLTLEPEAPLPTLDALLSRAVSPNWVNQPWWLLVQQ